MRLIKTVLIGFLFTGIALLTSCKKETTIERNLWKNGGVWNIESLFVKQTSTNVSDNFNETIYNYGTFTFRKDGSGIVVITVDGDVETEVFTYSNTKDKLTLIYGNEGRVFDMDWRKNDLTLSITDNFTSDDLSFTYSEIYRLKKK
ncbi:MAG: hypothetical protein RBS19_05360 [Bacteroidales bacterium]|nr:hypothetical protein [Bacteroidales bacterium]MDY0216364.1 hypothetical protein [Bacteroidales bacterium]